MVESAHRQLSITVQCRLLSIGRSAYHYAPAPESAETLALMAVIDTVFLDCPWATGSGAPPYSNLGR